MSGHRSHYASTGPLAVTPEETMRQNISAADVAQNEAARRKKVLGLQKDADSFGGLPSALPVIKAGMSDNEVAAAQQRINFLKGRTGSVSATTGAPKQPAIGAPDGSAPAVPNQNRTAGGGAFRGSSNAEIKDFYDSDPINGTAAKAKAAEVGAAAGKGTVVDTPYRKVSSTDVTKGKGSTWQEQIANKYPEIGKSGSPANIAFTKEYNDSLKSGNTPLDPHTLADRVMQQGPTPSGATVAGDNKVAFPLSGNNVGGVTAGAQGTGVVPTPGPAAQAGRTASAVGSAAATGAAAAVGSTGAAGAGAAAGQFLNDTVKPFFKGFMGGTEPASAPTPTAPAPVSTDPAPLPKPVDVPATGTASLPTGPKQPVPAMALPPLPAAKTPSESAIPDATLSKTQIPTGNDAFASLGGGTIGKFAENADDNDFKKKLNYAAAA